MKYLSVDLETTGLDPTFCQILEIGAVIDDTSWSDKLSNWKNGLAFGGRPFFHCYVIHEKMVGTPFALTMNAKIIERIAKSKDFPQFKFFYPNRAMAAFSDFIAENFPQHKFKKVTVAGKNFSSFDRSFLAQMPESKDVLDRFHHRVLDPVSLYFEGEDTELPNLETCLKRAGIGGEVTHNACDDAWQVIQVLRAKLVP